jgi:WD40 repeat protein
MADLEAVEGKQGDALSTHADEVLAEIQAKDPKHLKAAEWLFRSLTELDSNAENRVIRRPRNLAELIAVARGDRTGMIAVIEAFQGAGRNFLVTNPPGQLQDETEIDITHEALIRRWPQLSDPTRDPVKNEPVGWVRREFEDGQRWRALAVQARVFRNDKSATLSPATTEAYEPWWPQHTRAWAARYARDNDSASQEYEDVEDLWQASKKALEVDRTRLQREAEAANERAEMQRQLAEEKAQQLRFQSRISWAAGLAAVLLAILGGFAWFQRGEAVRERDNATKAEIGIKQEKERADGEREKAQSAHNKAQKTQFMYLANVARERRADGDPGTAILLALAALPDPGAEIVRPYVAEAELQLEGALRALRERTVLKGHENSVNSAEFSPDGKRIVTASEDNTTRLWDAETGQPIGEPLKAPGGGFVYSAAYSPDGKRIVTASLDKTARLWNAETGKPIGQPLEGHAGAVLSAAFSHDGKRIVTASFDNTARLWDAETGKPIGEPLEGHAGAVWSAAFSLDGKRIVTASDDMTVRLWDAETGQPIGEPLRGHEQTVMSAVFSPDGKRIVTGSLDKTLRLWDAETGQPIGEALKGHGKGVNSTAFSLDGKRIVSASDDNTARLWDAETGKSIGEPLKGHEDEVARAAFSPDGKRIVTASLDKTARLWDAETGKPIGEPLKGHRIECIARRSAPTASASSPLPRTTQREYGTP